MNKRIARSTLLAALTAAFIALPAAASEPGDPPRHIPWSWDDYEEAPRPTRAETERQQPSQKGLAPQSQADQPSPEFVGELGW
ncbi:hypothetical protein HUS23_03835 [Ectothiorhodospiraceae bacterium 2226]|nr:hypothetical protein HUS23_03835 [Ectothiorhodospiraceae bacterium 2226]